MKTTKMPLYMDTLYILAVEKTELKCEHINFHVRNQLYRRILFKKSSSWDGNLFKMFISDVSQMPCSQRM